MKNNSFEKLKNGVWKKIIIGSTCLVAVLSVGIFATSRAKYKLTESINIVNGTINYKVPDLNIVGLYVKDEAEYIESNNIPASGYTLNTEKSVCKIYDGSTLLENAPIDTSMTIEYSNGKVNFLGISKRNTRCCLYFDKEKIGADTILANITVKEIAPTFNSVATTDEGVYKVSDGMYGGDSYYWRGKVENNYVKFAGFCWRIVRINGDKTIRLIYDGTTCHANGTKTANSIAVASQKYNSSYNQSNYVGWTYEGTSQRTTRGTSSNAKTQLESWYSTNITGTNATKVATGKFCNDRDAQSGNTWAINGSTFSYAAYKRMHADYAPTLSCSSYDIYQLNVGTITADEVTFAGGVYGSTNSSYYLYNGQYYWTISPYYWDGYGAVMFSVYSEGQLSYYSVSSSTPGLRPVINLSSDITISSGDGSLNSPFIVN